MPLTYAYADPYLAPLVTPEIEARADSDVADIGTFTTRHTEKLTRLRAYILVCIESQRTNDDVFAAKLTAYRREFTEALAAARSSTAEGPPPRFRSVGLGRG